MIRVSILATLLALKVSTAFAEDDIYGEFKCTVKDISVAGHKDGVIKKYSGIEGGIELADEIKVKYSHDHGAYGSTTTVTVSHKSIPYILRANPWFYGDEKLFNASIYRYGLETGRAHHISDALGELILGEDVVFARGKADPFYNASLSMSRYFKNDWSAVLTNHRARGKAYAEVYLMDCRHTTDSMDAILDSHQQILDAKNAMTQPAKLESDEHKQGGKQ
jgi:hypothetical protein